jgi:hypothetical protein
MSLPRTVVTFISGVVLALSPRASHGAEPGNCFSEKNDLLVVDRDRVGLSAKGSLSLSLRLTRRVTASSARRATATESGPADRS